jgi:hypothetical protein
LRALTQADDAVGPGTERPGWTAEVERGAATGVAARALRRALFGGALSLTAVLLQPSAHAACAPVALVQGPPTIARAIEAILRAHGVGSDPSACPGQVVHAFVVGAPSSPDYALQIRDAFGRASERRVGDAVTAATLFETWATNEDADVLGPRSAPANATAVVAATATVVPHPLAWRAGAAMEATAGTDGSLWYGGSATVCLSLGSFCIGGRVRIARDDGDAGPAAAFDQVQTTGEALIVAALPRSFGQFSLAPLVGLGAAWTKVSQAETDSASASRIALRAEAALTAGIALSRAWSITGELGVALDGPSSSSVPASGFSMPGPVALFRGGIGIGYAP